MKTENIIGLSLISIGGFFLYRSFKGKQTSLGGVEGLNIKLNPEMMVDAAVYSSRKIPNELKEPISRFGKNFVNGLINGGQNED